MKTWVIFIFLTLLCTACTPDDVSPDEIYTQLTSVYLKAGDEIPVPTDETILTVSGRIGTTNVDGKIEMDQNMIIRTGLVSYHGFDIFEEVDHTFKGALLHNLVDLWQIDEGATTLHIVALNDYAVDVPLTQLEEMPIFYAMWTDDVLMDPAYRGSAMLVYPMEEYGLDRDEYARFWVWQIKEIEVR